MKRILVLNGILMLLLLQHKGLSQDTLSNESPLSLKQCVDIALKNNAEVNRRDLQMQNSKTNVTLAQGNLFPFVSGNINHSFSQGRVIDPFTNNYINQNLTSANYSADASIALWNAGAIRYNIGANKLGYEASRMDLQQQKDNATIGVILAYLQVLNNEEQLNAAFQQAEVTRSQVERLAALHKEGAVAPATYYDTKGQLASEEINVIALKNAVETAKLTLCQLMNVLYDPLLKLEKITFSGDLAMYDGNSRQIYQEALRNLALIKAVDYRNQSANKAIKSAKGQMYPTLSLFGGLGTNYSSAASTSTLTGSYDQLTENYVLSNGEKLNLYVPTDEYVDSKISYGDQWQNNFNSYVGIGLRIPMLNGFQAKTRVKAAKIEADRTQLEVKTTRTQLQQAIEQAYLNMNTAYERYQKLNAQVVDFTESFRTAEVRFNAGVINSVDYLIAKNNMDRSNINLISTKYDYILRTKILDFYQGRLSL